MVVVMLCRIGLEFSMLLGVALLVKQGSSRSKNRYKQIAILEPFGDTCIRNAGLTDFIANRDRDYSLLTLFSLHIHEPRSHIKVYAKHSTISISLIHCYANRH